MTLLDVGITDAHYAGLIPARDFTALRREDPEQHRYLLGDEFEGIPWGAVRPGVQLTPPRQHIVRDVERWTPFVSDTLKQIESLTYGGLGSGRGLGCFVFSDATRETLRARDRTPAQRARRTRRAAAVSDADTARPPASCAPCGAPVIALHCDRRESLAHDASHA